MPKLYPGFKRACDEFYRTLADNPTGEKPLEALIKVEQIVREEIDKGREFTNCHVDEVMRDICGNDIYGMLDEIHEAAGRAIDDNPEKFDLNLYLAQLKIDFEKTESVILPTMDVEINAGSKIGVEVGKNLKENKLKLLLKFLGDKGIYTDDLHVIVGKNHPTMMRNGSYLYIDIPKAKRVILLNLGWGEATFVLCGDVDREKTMNMGKDDLESKLGARKINFKEDNIEKWLADLDEAMSISDVPDFVKLNIPQREFFMREIKKLWPEPVDFMKLTQPQMYGMKISGKGLIAVFSKIMGKSGNPRTLRLDQAILARAVYGEGHECIEVEFWSKEEWIEKVKAREGSSTMKAFVSLTSTQRHKFNIAGKGLRTIFFKVTGKKGNPRTYISDLIILAEAVYGESEESIQAELIMAREELINKIKGEYPDPKNFMNLTPRKNPNVKVAGKGLFAISSELVGHKGNPLNSNFDLATLAQAIYGKGYECIDIELLTRKDWINKIKNLYPDPNGPADFMSMNQVQKGKVEINGKGLTAVFKKVVGKKGNPIGLISDQAVLARAVFEEGYECIDIELLTREDWIKKIKDLYPDPNGYDDFTAFTLQQKRDFTIHGKKLRAIYSKIMGKFGNPVDSSSDFVKLANVVYGKTF